MEKTEFQRRSWSASAARKLENVNGRMIKTRKLARNVWIQVFSLMWTWALESDRFKIMKKHIFYFQELLQMIRHLSPFERLHLKVRCVSINAQSYIYYDTKIWKSVNQSINLWHFVRYKQVFEQLWRLTMHIGVKNTIVDGGSTAL